MIWVLTSPVPYISIFIVRSIEERRSSREGPRSSDHAPFNRFIDETALIDLPLSGRKFTWYKSDSLSMSRLDRFLLSEEWCLTWPNCTQVAQMRGLYDHCPLVLMSSEENWGPRPIRMLKYWKDVPGYYQFVRDKWNVLHIDGIATLKGRLSALEDNGEEDVLTAVEMEELHGITLASRGRGNAISAINANGIILQGVQPIRQVVFSHFAAHFKASTVDRPGVENLHFRQLTPNEGGNLTKPFSLEEVKAAVWDCDSYKSPGPDGINFGFIKDFGTEMQADNMHFMVEFHRNGRVISESQTAFVKDRQILDEILITNEAVDEARTKSWANVRAMRAALVLFMTMSGLTVNFNKSMLVGVNISESWLQAAENSLRCKVRQILFIYLGLPIGGNLRHLSFWEPVLTRIQNRLSGWKSCFLSFGGRLILLKSILTSLHVYVISFFKAPSGKWCWRMLVDKEGLWFRVLTARYGIERGRLREGGRSESSWWREIVRIQDGVANIGGGWFGESVRFQCLFDLTINKSSTVAECFSLGWGLGGVAWVWWRQLWAWEEEMLGECQALLHNFVLQDQSLDVWHWWPDPIRGYSVRETYQILTSHQSMPLANVEDLIWHKQVPLKVSIFTWILLHNMLPTKVNLANRGITTPEAQSCVAGCGALESAQHLFISCNTFGSLWLSVRSWRGVSSADPLETWQIILVSLLSNRLA
ncbi:hypothetical protein TSUD_248070 [Trifolium subterraneum]|uniref:Reverse transcriptase zinc-binding domain-containing protein n=1 Tax=Trifolium subterraneum TaxID=3900 RepID=A0A2Z6NGX0_TRISU|nr:hypothetical protein TSUD_248070 [Trifolium subterraneum]